MDDIFSWTLMPGQETMIEIVTRYPKSDGTYGFEHNALTLAPVAPVKIQIASGPLTEVTIGRASKASPLPTQ